MSPEPKIYSEVISNPRTPTCDFRLDLGFGSKIFDIFHLSAAGANTTELVAMFYHFLLLVAMLKHTLSCVLALKSKIGDSRAENLLWE